MELQFEKTTCTCLRRILGEVRSLEQAQEIRLSDGMPDIGKVLCGWGQVIQRSKEWSGDSVSLSAGMMTWVLYAPEDGTAPRWVEGWIPFQVSWDLPETAGEGRASVQCRTRFVDARSVSARKIMVRAGISALAEAYVPMEGEIALPGEVPENLELKKVRYPLRLPREAGEKTFSMEEELTLPGSLPTMEKPVYYTLEPEVQEQRVLGDKVVFRGSARLHLLYEAEEGGLRSWDFSLPFSQFGELDQTRSEDAQVALHMAVTALELEQQDSSTLHLKCGLTGQYLVDDQELLELVEDAYCLDREIGVEQDSLGLPGILESRKETVSVEQAIPGEGTQALDVTFYPDFPRQRMLENGLGQELQGVFQVLYEAPDGSLQAAVSRWEGQQKLAADPGCQVSSETLPGTEPQILMGGGDMKIRTELPVQTTVTAGAGIPMVTGLSLGEPREPEENRPSLILRRAGTGDLWDIAKHSGSTVGAIRSANHLTEESVPGQMLLIPIL